MDTRRKISRQDFDKFLADMAATVVRVGLDQESAALSKTVRTETGIETDPSLTLGEVAAWNEFGTPKIPARPAFTAAAHNPDTKVAAIGAMENSLRQSLDAKAAFKNVGEAVLPLMKAAVADRDTPPNAPFTVAKKGFNDPLEDTEQLHNSLVSLVTFKGAKLVRIEGEQLTAR